MIKRIFVVAVLLVSAAACAPSTPPPPPDEPVVCQSLDCQSPGAAWRQHLAEQIAEVTP